MTSLVTYSELMQQFDLDYFKEGATFGALSEEGLVYLLQNGEIEQLESGDRLFSLDDPADCFYVILDGWIGFYKPGKQGRTHIRDYTFGTELGFVSMIGLHPRLGDGDASAKTLLLKVSCDLFSDLHRDLPNDFGVLLLNLSREMSRRLRDADRRIAELE
ncbi:MAG: cyclic nucleotide-binding domain-containing protein [Amphritea sp.]|nr:cyclic nucleotide-binding domain-containing protein [Amphritea sp.]